MSRYFSTIVKHIEGKNDLPKLCKDCKYFRPDNFYFLSDIFFTDNRYRFGKCSKSMDIDLLSGKKTYDYASTVREFNCKGQWFTSR
jgi:hypothetical protein